MMNDYRAAYENYYRNINKHPRVEKNINSREKKKINISSSSKSNFEKFLLKQVFGALMVLFYFSALKYIPVNNVQYIYNQSRNLIIKNVTYDDMIEGIKTVNIGGHTAGDINVNGITIDDFKEKPIKEKISQCFNYFNQGNKNEEKQV